MKCFFAEYWEKKHLVIQPANDDRFRDLIGIDDVDRILTTLNLRFPEIRLAKGDETANSEDFTLPGGGIDPLAVTKMFSGGTTIILDQMQRRLPALGGLCRELEAELGIAFQTNIYLTPPNSRGFKLHYDTHDVFILQVEGTKLWRLYESPLKLPLPGQTHEKSGVVAGEFVAEFTLKAGDLAYIPRGLFHDANSNDCVSLHITLGAKVRSWCELLIEAISELSLRNMAFRQAIPVGLGTASFERGTAVLAFRELFKQLAEQLDIGAAIDSFTEEFRRSRDAGLQGQLSQIIDLAQLAPTSIVVARPCLMYHLVPGDDGITLTYLNQSISLPAQAAIGVEFLLSGKSTSIAEIPGPLDLTGKLVLARRLVAEGLVYVLSPDH